MKFICEECDKSCILEVGDVCNLTADILQCVIRDSFQTCKWKEYEDGEVAKLPKLTAEVFDRADCPEWAQWAAVDKCRNAMWYEREPKVVGSVFWNSHGGQIQEIPGKFDASDWQNSLIERPVKEDKLPEWCKPGAWIYTSSEQYFKVNGVSIDRQKIELSNGAIWSTQDIIDEAVPARLRPYNADEMKALFGRVIEKGPSMHIVTGFENVFDNECMVHVNGCLYGANDLLRQFTIDGKPCGVLEHLENGEWVQ